MGAQQPAEVGDGTIVSFVSAAGQVDEIGLEVERRRAPERPPPAREDLGAGAVLGGEERDDAAEDLVGEAADQIGVTAATVFFPDSDAPSGLQRQHLLPQPPPLAFGILLRHIDRSCVEPLTRNSGKLRGGIPGEIQEGKSSQNRKT